MSHRYRLYPTAEQEAVMRSHCGQARFVWNLALEQANCWRLGRAATPNWLERSRQLAEARRETWLGEGSSHVQQQALRDFDQAMKNWWGKSHRRPTRRRKGRGDGFRVVDVRVHQINRRWAEVMVPKCGRVRFRLSRALPDGSRSARVTLDGAGRWHVSFAALQSPVERRTTGTVVGVDRGVTTTLAASDGVFLRAPRRSKRGERRLVNLQRRLARQHKGSNRRRRTKAAITLVHQRQRDRLKNWTEIQTTRLVRSHDLIVVEALQVHNMVRRPKPKPDGEGGFEPNGARAKGGLNRSIHAQGWSQWLRRLREKAEASGVVVVEVPAQYTSQTCRACGVVAEESRESQASFRCVACGHESHADLNAAKNILARGLLSLAPTPGQGAAGSNAGARRSRHRGAARTPKGRMRPKESPGFSRGVDVKKSRRGKTPAGLLRDDREAMVARLFGPTPWNPFDRDLTDVERRSLAAEGLTPEQFQAPPTRSKARKTPR